MITCPNCNMDNIDGALFCDGCAWDLSDVPPTPGEPAPADDMAAEPMAAEPIADDAFAADPMAAEPMALDAMGEDPMAAEPLADDGFAADPMAAEPMPADSAAGEPFPADPFADDAATAPMTPSQMDGGPPVSGLDSSASGSGVMALEETPTVEAGEVELSLEAAPAVGEEPPVTGVTPSQAGMDAAPSASQLSGLQEMPASPSQLSGLQDAPPPSQLQAPTTEAPLTSPSPTVARLSPIALAKLVVVKGMKTETEYPVYEGSTFIGRFDEKPVDIDLTDQEDQEHPRASRQHACVSIEGGAVFIEDLNSSNGTFVNRQRVNPGEKRKLRSGDYIQTGTVMFQVKC